VPVARFPSLPLFLACAAASVVAVTLADEQIVPLAGYKLAGSVGALSLGTAPAQPLGPVTRGSVSTLSGGTQPVGSGSTNTCDVTSYGADPNAQRDSTTAIRKAIAACEAATGSSTVYLPAGTYKLNLNDGLKDDLQIKGPHPITVQGAGAALTRLVEWVGSVDYAQAQPKTVFFVRGVEGVVIKDLAVDTKTHEAGDAVHVESNNTTVAADAFTCGGHVASDVFCVRFSTGCTHDHLVYATGNVASDIVLSDEGLGGNAGFDFSCQANGTINNLNLTGSMLAMYVDKYVTVNGFTYTPGASQTNPRGWYITGPADHIAINDFTTYGQGGIIGQSNVYRVTNTTISNERMVTPGYMLAINDASDTVITGSSLQVLYFAPDLLTDGVSVSSTSVVSVMCAPYLGAAITNLNGVSCTTLRTRTRT
jgi:Pectate lyase superfamily protein